MKSKTTGRYQVPSSEDYEPGSNNEVLKNYLNIISIETMEQIEKQELKRTELELITLFEDDHQFTADDICDIHECWLGDIYPSAGKYRTISMEKSGFPFANPNLIDKLMKEFENNYLKKYTPCHYSEIDALAYAIGITHVELILIHPFREGNGRTARLLVDLMSIQAKRPPINYDLIDQNKNIQGFHNYILAIHAGVKGNYLPIQKLFMKLIENAKAN